jgi:hypothetical protein
LDQSANWRIGELTTFAAGRRTHRIPDGGGSALGAAFLPAQIRDKMEPISHKIGMVVMVRGRANRRRLRVFSTLAQ